MNKRKLIGVERLGKKMLKLVAGMAVMAGIATANVTPAEANVLTNPVVPFMTTPSVPGVIVLVPSMAANGEQIAYHSSHSSHHSHVSHSSHYSSRGY